MINTKTDPKGIDLYIQRFQTDVYNKLNAIWGGNHKSYGRCNRNLVNGNYVAEVYNPLVENEYTDILWDDEADAVSFFGIDTLVRDVVRQSVKVHMIIFCNVKKIKPSANGRADEEVKIDLLNSIGKALLGFHYESIETGMENVLKEYKGSLAKMKSIDMQPVHSFRINFFIHYNPNFTTQLKLN